MAKIVIVKDCILLENEDFNKFIQLVSLERKEKIMKYRNYSDKCRSLIAALLYRCLICMDYNVKNIDLRFLVEEQGKIVCNNKDVDVKFNVSHSGGYVVGIIDEKEVGIDVEKIGLYDSKIAERFFDSKEYEKIENSKNKSETFFKIWTLKEAYVKYLGMGMFKSFDSFRVEFADEKYSLIFDDNCKKDVKAVSYRLDNNYYVSSVSDSKITYEMWSLDKFMDNIRKFLQMDKNLY